MFIPHRLAPHLLLPVSSFAPSFPLTVLRYRKGIDGSRATLSRNTTLFTPLSCHPIPHRIHDFGQAMGSRCRNTGRKETGNPAWTCYRTPREVKSDRTSEEKEVVFKEEEDDFKNRP